MTLDNGVKQVLKILSTGQVGVLILDQDAWAKIPEKERRSAFDKLSGAGGGIVLRQGLYRDARERASRLKRFARWLTGDPQEKEQEEP